MIEFIQRFCLVPDGAHVGQPLQQPRVGPAGAWIGAQADAQQRIHAQVLRTEKGWLSRERHAGRARDVPEAASPLLVLYRQALAAHTFPYPRNNAPRIPHR